MRKYFLTYQAEVVPGKWVPGRAAVDLPNGKVISDLGVIVELEVGLMKELGHKNLLITGWQPFEQLPGSEY